MNSLCCSRIMSKLGLLLCFLPGFPPLCSSQSRPPVPVWSKEAISDLSGARNLGSPNLIDPNRAGVTFLDDEHVLVHEVDIDRGQLSSRHSAEVSSAFRLQLSVLDASTGLFVLAKELGARPRDTWVYSTAGGLVIRAGSSLKFFKKDFSEAGQISLSDENPYGRWEIRFSPSGKTILLNHYIRQRSKNIDFSQFQVIDGTTFKTTSSWTESPALSDSRYSVSDYLVAELRAMQTPARFMISKFGTKTWNKVWETTDQCVSRARLVADDQFVYVCREFLSVSLDGKSLMSDHFMHGETVGPSFKFSVGQNRKTVALSMENISDPTDTGGQLRAIRVVVYDLCARKSILSVSISPVPIIDFDFELSPDGTKLAILNDRTVSVYSVPSAPCPGD
jgi:hypothetical protein